MNDNLPPLPPCAPEFKPRWPTDPGGYNEEQMQAYARAAIERHSAAPQPQPVQEPLAWSERIKELADQYAIECVEFSKGIPNGAHSMSPIAVKAGDTRLALHSAIDTGERFIRAIESATLAAQVERATQPQPVQEPAMIYHGRCTIDCGEHGHQDVEMLKMIPAGSKLYTSPQAQPLSDEQARFQAQQQFLQWNRQQETPLVAVAHEYSVFRKAVDLYIDADNGIPKGTT